MHRPWCYYMKKYDKLIKQLEDMTYSANISCQDFTRLLEDIGFEIEHCGNAGHKIAKHIRLSMFRTTLTLTAAIIQAQKLSGTT